MKTLLHRQLLVIGILIISLSATSLSADQSSVWDQVQSNPETSTFAQYARELGLEPALNTKNLIIPWTLFVPNNTAFAKLPEAIKDKLVNDDQFKRQIITSHMVLGASVSVDGIGSGNTLTTASGLELDLIQRDKLYVKDVVVTERDLVGSNGVVHLVECVMYVQSSAGDDRLTPEQKSNFEQTACCLADSISDLHHQSLLNTK